MVLANGKMAETIDNSGNNILFMLSPIANAPPPGCEISWYMVSLTVPHATRHSNINSSMLAIEAPKYTKLHQTAKNSICNVNNEIMKFYFDK